MKNNLSITLLCILSGALAAPQNDLLQSIGALIGGNGGLQNILNNPVIQGRILSNNLNPCDGVPPSTCQCTDGESIPFSIEYRDNPCSGSARPDQCTCPNGNTFQIKDLADNVINQYNLPSCGRGVEPSICTSCRMVQLFNHNLWLDPPVVAEDWVPYPPPAPVQAVTPSPPMTSSPGLFLPFKTFSDKWSKCSIFEKLILTNRNRMLKIEN